MAHLAAGPRLALAVDVDVGTALRDQLAPAFDLAANEIFHDGVTAGEAGDSGRQSADRADMLLELRGDRALDGPMPAIVNARRDLVDDRPIGRGEILDRQH